MRLQVEIATASRTPSMRDELAHHALGLALGQRQPLAQRDRRGLVRDADRERARSCLAPARCSRWTEVEHVGKLALQALEAARRHHRDVDQQQHAGRPGRRRRRSRRCREACRSCGVEARGRAAAARRRRPRRACGARLELRADVLARHLEAVQRHEQQRHADQRRVERDRMSPGRSPPEVLSTRGWISGSARRTAMKLIGTKAPATTAKTAA